MWYLYVLYIKVTFLGFIRISTSVNTAKPHVGAKQPFYLIKVYFLLILVFVLRCRIYILRYHQINSEIISVST